VSFFSGSFQLIAFGLILRGADSQPACAPVNFTCRNWVTEVSVRPTNQNSVENVLPYVDKCVDVLRVEVEEALHLVDAVLLQGTKELQVLWTALSQAARSPIGALGLCA
jgi:hypothetical protein